MTPQRKTLLSVAAMLFCANAVALAVMIHKPAPTPDVWFGGDRPRPTVFDDEPFRSRPVYTLTEHGANLGGTVVPYAGIVSNMGREAYDEFQNMCVDWCLGTPWAAFAQPQADTSIAVVLEAAREVRARCNVEFVIFPSESSEFGATIVFEESSSRLGGMDDYPEILDPELMRHDFRNGETLEQFGERTGCARVSPLRP